MLLFQTEPPPALYLRHVSSGVLIVFGIVIAALAVGTIVRLAVHRSLSREEFPQRFASLLTWWVLAIALVVAVLIGREAAIVLVALLSFLAVREFFRMTHVDGADPSLRWWGYLAVPVQYGAELLRAEDLVAVLVPVGIFIGVAIHLVLREQTRGFTRTAAAVYFGIGLTVFCPAHAARLWNLPESLNPVSGNAGWFLYLVLLTELNDIAQALWGRKFGQHHLMPVVSPKKTWEGLAGGIVTTCLLALFLAPLLTPFQMRGAVLTDIGVPEIPFLRAIGAGLVIAIGGFLGDVTMSAIKRDVGVKDSGTLLPGQGGILDRIDSLTFTAPLFYYYVRYLTP